MTVYTVTAAESDAVTETVTVFAPVLRLSEEEAEPEAVAVPFTVMEAFASDAVGVTVMDETENCTEAV